jgi:hypothetical protein
MLNERLERIGAHFRAPMRQPSARHKLLPVAVNCPVVIARPVCIVVAHTGANDRTIIGRPVIVRRRVPIIAIVRRIIRGPIVTGVIRSHVRSLCTCAQETCNDTCAKDRQQQCWTMALGFHWCFHQVFPFSNSEFPFLFREAVEATPCGLLAASPMTVLPANLPSRIRIKSPPRSPCHSNYCAGEGYSRWRCTGENDATPHRTPTAFAGARTSCKRHLVSRLKHIRISIYV